jgi:hypothetical protein
MALDELNDILALLGDSDKTTLTDVLTRNEAARVALEGRESIFKAMVGGDQAAVERATHLARQQAAGGGQQQQQNNQQQQQQQSASVDLDDIWGKLSTRVDAKFTEQFAARQTDIRTLAKAVAEEVAKSYEGVVLGKAAKTSDEIYQIRRTHASEFGEELDTAALEKYLTDNPGKFNSLTTAHDSYVQQKRIDKAIADGISRGMETAETNRVAGHSALPDTMMGQMIANNTKRIDAAQGTTNGQARGEHLDAAAKAFRDLQNKRARGGETMA